MDAINFLTSSNASKEAFKTATLLKTLNLNAVIVGNRGVGKLTLAQYILPNATIIDASENEKLFQLIDTNSEIIIKHLDQSPNIQLLLKKIESTKTRVIATSINELSTDAFSMIINIPELIYRQEDIALLINKFQKEANNFFNEKFVEVTFTPDISLNAHSLKKQIYFYTVVHDIKESDLMQLMENYLYDKLGSSSDYSKFLPLYEAPLIKAGLKRFKSQLQLSDKLGLNRNTLRKKIQDNKEYLNE